MVLSSLLLFTTAGTAGSLEASMAWEVPSLSSLMYIIDSIPSAEEAAPQLEIVDDAYIYVPPTPQTDGDEPPKEVILGVGPLTNQAEFLPGDENPRYAGQCVGWVKYYAKVSYTGNAIDWRRYINTYVPEPGAIIVLAMSWAGHIGIVIDVSDGHVTYRSRNQNGLWVVSDTKLPLYDYRILGYIVEND